MQGRARGAGDSVLVPIQCHSGFVAIGREDRAGRMRYLEAVAAGRGIRRAHRSHVSDGAGRGRGGRNARRLGGSKVAYRLGNRARKKGQLGIPALVDRPPQGEGEF